MSEEANLERSLGRVEGKLDLILSAQAEESKTRRKHFERTSEVERALETLAADTARIEARLAAVEAPVAEFSKWRERAVGALMLISFMSAATGAALAAMWHQALEWFGLR